MPHTMFSTQFFTQNCKPETAFSRHHHRSTNNDYINKHNSNAYCIQMTMTLCTCTHLHTNNELFQQQQQQQKPFQIMIENNIITQKNVVLFTLCKLQTTIHYTQCKCNVALWITSFEIVINLHKKSTIIDNLVFCSSSCFFFKDF